MTDPAPVLTETDLFELLRLEFDADHLAHLIRRRQLPTISFKREGRTIRRFIRTQVFAWLEAEALKRTGKAEVAAGEGGPP